MIRRIVPLVIFALLLAGGIPPLLVRSLVDPSAPLRRPAATGAVDRHPLRERADPLPRQFTAFIDAVRQRTRTGEEVGLLLAPPFEGYAYWRACYMLAGRPVRPPGMAPRNGGVLVTWGPAAPLGWRVEWKSGPGAVWRPIR